MQLLLRVTCNCFRFCALASDRLKFIAAAWKFHLGDSSTGAQGFDFEHALQLLYVPPAFFAL